MKLLEVRSISSGHRIRQQQRPRYVVVGDHANIKRLVIPQGPEFTSTSTGFTSTKIVKRFLNLTKSSIFSPFKSKQINSKMRASIILSTFLAALAFALPEPKPQPNAELQARFWEDIAKRHCPGGSDDNICGEGFFFVCYSFPWHTSQQK